MIKVRQRGYEQDTTPASYNNGMRAFFAPHRTYVQRKSASKQALPSGPNIRKNLEDRVCDSRFQPGVVAQHAVYIEGEKDPASFGASSSEVRYPMPTPLAIDAMSGNVDGSCTDRQASVCSAYAASREAGVRIVGDECLQLQKKGIIPLQ